MLNSDLINNCKWSIYTWRGSGKWSIDTWRGSGKWSIDT